MNCPECGKSLRWVGDEIFDEITYKYLETTYDCSKCNIDVLKRIYIYPNENKGS